MPTIEAQGLRKDRRTTQAVEGGTSIRVFPKAPGDTRQSGRGQFPCISNETDSNSQHLTTFVRASHFPTWTATMRSALCFKLQQEPLSVS